MAASPQTTPGTPRGRFSVLRSQRRGIDAVEADTAMAFGRHTHEQFGIGLIDRGAQRSASGRGTVEAGAGDIITVNPGEVHDGAPIGDGGRSWRMLYLEPALITELSADIAENATTSCAEFSEPALRDRRLAARFDALFRTITATDADQAALSTDETLLMFLGALLQPCRTVLRQVPSGIASARALIDDDPLAELTLGRLASEAVLGRYQFLRGFTRATGMTPHAYLMQQRIHLARRLIAGGMRLADAAAASAFSDQSHMTRRFVRSFGMAPGAYARALG